MRVRRSSRSIDYRRRTALYRLFDSEGRLLYVDIAFDPKARWSGRARVNAWRKKQAIQRRLERLENPES